MCDMFLLVLTVTGQMKAAQDLRMLCDPLVKASVYARDPYSVAMGPFVVDVNIDSEFMEWERGWKRGREESERRERERGERERERGAGEERGVERERERERENGTCNNLI